MGYFFAVRTPFLSFHGLELAQAIHADTQREAQKIREQAKRLLDVK